MQENHSTIELSEITGVEVIKGYTAKFVHTQSMTLAFWEVSEGAVMPMHKHIHEQISQVEAGEFQLTIDGVTRTYTKGMIAVIAPNVEHGGVALTNCKLVDIFQPVRDDYKQLSEQLI